MFVKNQDHLWIEAIDRQPKVMMQLQVCWNASLLRNGEQNKSDNMLYCKQFDCLWLNRNCVVVHFVVASSNMAVIVSRNHSAPHQHSNSPCKLLFPQRIHYQIYSSLFPFFGFPSFCFFIKTNTQKRNVRAHTYSFHTILHVFLKVLSKVWVYCCLILLQVDIFYFPCFYRIKNMNETHKIMNVRSQTAESLFVFTEICRTSRTAVPLRFITANL